MSDFIALLGAFAVITVEFILFAGIIIASLYLVGIIIESYQINKKDKK